MALATGSVSLLQISSDNVTYYDVGNIKTDGLDVARDFTDANDNDNGGWKKALAGDASGTLAVEMNANTGNTGQDMVAAAFYAGTTRYFRFRRLGTGSGLPQEKFQGYVENLRYPTEHAVTQVITFNVRADGAVDPTVQ